MAKRLVTIHPTFLFALSINFVSFYIYVSICSKLQGSFFCAANVSCAYLNGRKEKFHDIYVHDFKSNKMDYSSCLALTDNKDNIWPAHCE